VTEIVTLKMEGFEIRALISVNGVFARKLIPKCTQFGPMEGVVGKVEPADDRKLELLIESKSGSFLSLDMSDENTSNWMRFVRPAEDCREQNVVLSQHEGSLYFTTTRDIQPRQELLVWYSQGYAARRGLKLLEPQEPWTCFKCNDVFNNSVDIQKHLNVHASEQVLAPSASLHFSPLKQPEVFGEKISLTLNRPKYSE